jgi:hypothetical protein
MKEENKENYDEVKKNCNFTFFLKKKTMNYSSFNQKKTKKQKQNLLFTPYPKGPSL